MENITENDFSQPEETSADQVSQAQNQIQQNYSEPEMPFEEEEEGFWGRNKVIIISILVALVLLAGGGCAYFLINKAKEQKDYDALMQASENTQGPIDLAAFDAYIDKYDNFLCPNKGHLNSIIALKNDLKDEQDAWDKIAKSDDIDKIRKYLHEHSDSRHSEEAKNLLDSISWGEALRLNNEDAYEEYLRITRGKGKHADEANEYLSLQLNDYEEDMAESYLNSFFYALSSNDEARLTRCIENDFTYNGKKATKSDMLNVMESLFSDNVNYISIEPSEQKVKKIMGGEGEFSYSIDFAADMHISYDTYGSNYYYDEYTGEYIEETQNKKLPTYKNYSGTAVITTDGKVSSFTWKKVAEHSKDVR